jgi:hypothetical protein
VWTYLLSTGLAGSREESHQRRGEPLLRFPSLALSRSGTKGISHPETKLQDP